MPDFQDGREARTCHTRAKCTQVIIAESENGKALTKHMTNKSSLWLAWICLLPASFADPPRIHLAHIAHTNNANGGILLRAAHVGRLNRCLRTDSAQLLPVMCSAVFVNETINKNLFLPSLSLSS